MASFWKDGSNNRYYVGRQFIYLNNAYIGSSSIFTGLGFTEVTIDPKPDERYYIVSGPNDDGTWTSTARDLPTLKEESKVRQTRSMRSALSSSIEEVLFAFQDSGSIPTDWANFRTDTRTARNNQHTKIDAAADNAALEALVEAPKWVLVDPNNEEDGYELNPNPYLDLFPLDPDEIARINGTITIQRNGAALQNAKFRDNNAADPHAQTVLGVWPYDLTLRLVTNDVTLTHAMPDGYSDATQLGTGSQDVELKYNDEVIATFTLTTSTSPQVFTFG